MIDRTTFDLRIAEHQNIAAQANRQEWKVQSLAPVQSTRVILAQALVALAARLAPEYPAKQQPATM